MGQVIGVDFGHGNQTTSSIVGDGGAIGFIAEETIINEVGAFVVSKLKALGHTVIELRPTSASSVNDSLYQRYHTSDINNCDYCISLHANAGCGVGTEVFTYGGKEITEARNILNNIVSLGFANRGIKDGSSLCMVRRPQATAFLIEICFVDTQSDVDKYNSIGAEAIADAIVKGLTGSTVQSTKYKVGWNEDNGGWFYSIDGDTYYKSQWKQIADSNNPNILYYYYFNDNGYILTNHWKQESDGKWYYLDNNGNMVQARSPEVVKWKLIGGKYYAFSTSGSLYVGCITNDGWTVNPSGEWDSSIPRK